MSDGRLRELALRVLHAVTFVDDHMDPIQPTENRSIFDDVLVSGKQDLELADPGIVLQRFPLSRVTLVRYRLDTRSPLRKLSGPIRHRGKRYNDEIWPMLAFRFDEEGDERDSLNCFAKTLLPSCGK